jgi:dTDP-4-dehydrorhamnose reductase
MKIIILGANSQLAKNFIKQLKKNKIRYKALSRQIAGNNYLEKLLKPNSRINKKIKVSTKDIIIIFFGISAQKECEKNKKKSKYVNYFLTKKIIRKYKNNYLVFLSSSAVFGGSNKRYYNEDAKVCPESYYGFLKLKVENFIKKELKKYLIIRSGWVVTDLNRCIVYDTLNNIRLNQLIIKKNTITNIISATDYSNNLINLLKKKKLGIFHFTNNHNVRRSYIANQVLKKIHNKKFKFAQKIRINFKKNIDFVLKSKKFKGIYSNPKKIIKMKLRKILKNEK